MCGDQAQLVLKPSQCVCSFVNASERAARAETALRHTRGGRAFRCPLPFLHLARCSSQAPGEAMSDVDVLPQSKRRHTGGRTCSSSDHNARVYVTLHYTARRAPFRVIHARRTSTRGLDLTQAVGLSMRVGWPREVRLVDWSCMAKNCGLSLRLSAPLEGRVLRPGRRAWPQVAEPGLVRR